MSKPHVVDGSQLRTIDVNGRPCEICDESMLNHAWVLMDDEGFVLFCSNLTFQKKGKEELHSTIYYKTEPFEEVFTHVTAGSTRTVNEEVKSQELAIKSTERHVLDDAPDSYKGEVYTYRQYIFLGNRKSIAKVGDWSELHIDNTESIS